MAHVAKVKGAGVGPMVGHYAREAELERGYRRENIDPARTPLNYAVGFESRSPAALAVRVRERVSEAIREHEEVSGKSVRKDANVLMDWVVTAPKDLREEDSERFFETVVGFIQDRYGAENVPGGFVHLDEASRHVHVPLVPVLDGKLVAAKVVNRADLLSFHGDLGRAVDEALGYHVSVELSEEQRGEKQLSALSQDEYRAAKDRLECLRQRESELGGEVEGLREQVRAAELEPPVQNFAESARTLLKARGDGEREEVLAGELEGLRERLRAAEGTRDGLGERVRGLEAEAAELGERVEQLGERIEGARAASEARAGELERELGVMGERVIAARDRVEDLRGMVEFAVGRLSCLVERAAEAIERAPHLLAWASEQTLEVLERFGVVTKAPREAETLEQVMNRAQRAAARQETGPTPQRRRGIGR